MTDGHATGADRLARRAFLRRGTATSSAALGFGLLVGQPDETVPRVNAVLPRLDILANQYLRRLVVFTEELDEPPPDELVAECYPADGPSRLVAHEAVVADWEGITRLTPDRLQEATDRVVPTRGYLPSNADVGLGAPFVIVGGNPCVDRFLRVEAHKLPEAVRGNVGRLADG